jgi:hypothetical protein
MSQKLKKLLVTGPVTPNQDNAKHVKKFTWFFIAASVYAVAYGIYEYFIVYTNLRLITVLKEWTNWTIMLGGFLLVIIIVTRFNFENIVMGLLYMFTLEDLVYWICNWIDTGVYPFPAGDWWDSFFASFRVLGNLGQPLPFWPPVPLFYIPAFSIMIAYVLLSLHDARYSRAFSWVIGPIFVAIIVGTLGNEQDAILLLLLVPTVSYCYAGILLILKKTGRLGES